MGLTALDILVLITVGGAAVTGLMRGFVTEVLSLMAWIFVVFALKLFHTPATAYLTDSVGTAAGAATLAFAAISGVTWFGGRMVANAIGSRTRSSVLGPVDRALGFGFGALKGLILASLGFLLIVLVIDTISGGPTRRPAWITASRTYPLLNATSASIADFVDRRRRGQPVFGSEDNASVANESVPAEAR
ncbi:membrane protein required for colicin V production [Sphingomonas guangdongensis]|uniref:Membrane protein required for colicin V production n=1 Tax=Sphingomonas guangdongensis TaxID=1141890 RepID=A0A285QZI6_9SPHN|nr:CvpA family protein [Sphingomonas guangdongensis]SOB86799.1 membrane protein required for colicin V production [Sphingomonas guangdongensis]